MRMAARLAQLAMQILSPSHLAELTPRSPSGEMAESRGVVREEGGGAIERRENKVFVLQALSVHEPCDYGERATRCKVHDQACL